VHISRLLVVYKKSYYELYGYEKRKRELAALPPKQHSMIQAMRLSHEENQRTLTAVCHALDVLNVSYDCLYRGELKPVTGYDLVLSVGGDGTLLEVARYVGDLPILGVNSDPSRSTAFFCAADRSSIASCLGALLAGHMHQLLLARLQIALNDVLLPFYALNDILIAHSNPAAMASYILCLDGICENQKSSGIWIATAAGSTAAIRSAGGRVLPLQSRTRQYLVREPYTSNDRPYQFLQGGIPPDVPIELISRMRRGRLFLDGPHLRYPLGLGDTLSVTLAPIPLRLVGINGERQQQF
jgi:NAD+ kinase